MLPEDLHKDWKPGDPIGYIQPEIPKVDLPPCRGERYEAEQWVEPFTNGWALSALVLHC
jgi:hypothetical protein